MHTSVAGIVGLALLTAAMSAVAEPLELKCITNEGEAGGYLTVDLDRKTMGRGGMHDLYIITKITDEYITAARNENKVSTDVGGELLVFNRILGEYKIYEIGLFCGNEKCIGGNRVLRSFIYSGKCFRPIL
jgi:hypothetical protein